MKCGNCKEHHDTVAQVKECYAVPEFPLTSGAKIIKFPTPVERLKAAASKLPDEAHAYYAVYELDFEREPAERVVFYRVDKPRGGPWEGRTFVSRQSSDNFHALPFKQAITVLEAIAADPIGALQLYGRLIGSCGVCHRTLTDPESIRFGIGPVCRERLGVSA